MRIIIYSIYLWIYKFFHWKEMWCNGFCPTCKFKDQCIFEKLGKEKKNIKLYVIEKESEKIIEEVKTIKEGEKLINELENDDKKNEKYKPNYYEIVTEKDLFWF